MVQVGDRKGKDGGGQYQPLYTDEPIQAESGEEVEQLQSREDPRTSIILVEHLKSFRKTNRSRVYVIFTMIAALVVFLIFAAR